MSIEGYLRAVPKAELHVHLEGSIQPGTLLTLAARNGIALPAATEAELRAWFAFRDFTHFVDVYRAICTCLKTADDYELAVVELAAALAGQQVRYAEVTFTPSAHHHLGVNATTFMDGIERGRERAASEHGVEIAWVFDIIRGPVSTERFAKLADYTIDLAIASRDRGVVALGLGGIEAGNPPEQFEPWFERARAAGLRSAPHAGEFGGPESVRGAIERLGAERIGHGVRASEDPAVVALLVERGIPIEVSPVSNVRLGVYPSLAAHPFRRLREAGVIATVNTDDPPLFNVTLNDEVMNLSTVFGYGVEEIDEILLDAVRCSFLPAERRIALEATFREEMTALKLEHGLT